MQGRVAIAVTLLDLACSFMCSSINVGTDILNVKDAVNSGKVQTAWGPRPTKKFPPAVSEFYLYVEGLSHLGPEFRALEFHHEDEDAGILHSWIRMNVTEDDQDSGLLDKITVYKVTQECRDRDGGLTLLLNVTFAAMTCDPITVSWLKICGEPSQPAKGLFVGFSATSREIADDGVITPMFDANTKDDVYKVPYDEEETTLFIYLKGVNEPVFLSAPIIIADHEVLYPVLNGSAASGGWVSASPMDFKIAYNCLKEKGIKEEVILVLELPYFRNLEVHFLKQCGVAKPKTNMPWLKLFLIISAATVGVYSVAFMLLWFQRGEDAIEALPLGAAICWLLQDLKGRVSTYRYHPVDSPTRELPNFPLKTQYGTV